MAGGMQCSLFSVAKLICVLYTVLYFTFLLKHFRKKCVRRSALFCHAIPRSGQSMCSPCHSSSAGGGQRRAICSIGVEWSPVWSCGVITNWNNTAQPACHWLPHHQALFPPWELRNSLIWPGWWRWSLKAWDDSLQDYPPLCLLATYRAQIWQISGDISGSIRRSAILFLDVICGLVSKVSVNTILF